MAGIAKCNQIISRLPIRVRVVQSPMVSFCGRTATTRLTGTFRSGEKPLLSQRHRRDADRLRLDGPRLCLPHSGLSSLGGLPTQGTVQTIAWA